MKTKSKALLLTLCAVLLVAGFFGVAVDGERGSLLVDVLLLLGCLAAGNVFNNPYGSLGKVVTIDRFAA